MRKVLFLLTSLAAAACNNDDIPDARIFNGTDAQFPDAAPDALEPDAEVADAPQADAPEADAPAPDAATGKPSR